MNFLQIIDGKLISLSEDSVKYPAIDEIFDEYKEAVWTLLHILPANIVEDLVRTESLYIGTYQEHSKAPLVSPLSNFIDCIDSILYVNRQVVIRMAKHLSGK